MTSDWKFDNNIVSIFDEHVRQNVPMYDEVHGLITDMAGWFLEDSTNVYDIGTSTGEVLWNLLQRYPQKKCKYVGFDTSDDMVAKAQVRFEPYPNVSVMNKDIRVTDLTLSKASFITCILTLHFLPIQDRLPVLERIYQGLNYGGGFILLEKVTGQNARFNEMWVELYHEMKLRNGMTEQEVFQKARAIRGVLKPLSLEENLALVKQAGFRDVDVFFKWSNFVGIVAIK